MRTPPERQVEWGKLKGARTIMRRCKELSRRPPTGYVDSNDGAVYPRRPVVKGLVYPCWTLGGLLFPLNRACFRQVRARIWKNLENGDFQPTQMKLVDFAPPRSMFI